MSQRTVLFFVLFTLASVRLKASPSGQESPPKTPQPKKRTLKDMVCEKDSTEKKRARTWAQKCGDNEKRSQCQLCKAPRSEDQRGGVCNSCLKAFRKLTGHQNMSKCKDDKDLMQDIAWGDAKAASEETTALESPTAWHRSHAGVVDESFWVGVSRQAVITLLVGVRPHDIQVT